MILVLLLGLGTFTGPKAYFTANFNGNIRPCCPGLAGGLVRAAYILHNFSGFKIDIGNYVIGVVDYDTVVLKIIDEAGYDALGIGYLEKNLIEQTMIQNFKTPIISINNEHLPSFFIKKIGGKRILYTSTHSSMIDTIFSQEAEYYIVSTTDTIVLKKLAKIQKENLFIVVSTDSPDELPNGIIPVKTGFITMLNLAQREFEYIPIEREGPEHSKLARMADEIYSMGEKPALALEIFYKNLIPVIFDSITSSLSPIYKLQIIKHNIELEGDAFLSRIARSFEISQEVPLIYISKYGLVIENYKFANFLEFIKKPQTVTISARKGCKECGRIKYLLSSIKEQFPLLEIEWIEVETETSSLSIGEDEYPIASITYNKLVEIIKEKIWQALKNF